jgi:hypothetical protein
VNGLEVMRKGTEEGDILLCMMVKRTAAAFMDVEGIVCSRAVGTPRASVPSSGSAVILTE